MYQSKKVSVIIPTFNRATLIKRAVDSVFLQNYTDIEIIIVDDNSADNTFEVIKKYNDKRIVYLKNEYNYGASKSRNIGINYAKGDFITFLDSDDEWLPGKLISEIRLLENNPNCLAVSFDQVFINQKNNKIIKRKNFLKNNRNNIKYISQKDVLRGNCLLTNDFTIRKEILSKIKGFDENLPSRQDWDIWIKITSFGTVIQSSSKLTNKYVFHGEQISSDLKKKTNGTVSILNKYKNLFVYDGKAYFRIILIITFLYIIQNKKNQVYLFITDSIPFIKNKIQKIILTIILLLIKVFKYKGVKFLKFVFKVTNPNSYLIWES